MKRDPLGWFRMALATQYDRLVTDSCWTDTCTSLGLGYDLRGFIEKIGQDSAARCIREADEMGSCYCGKFIAARLGGVVRGRFVDDATDTMFDGLAEATDDA